MTEIPGKSAFGAFLAQEGGTGTQALVGVDYADLTPEQALAAETLRAWDAMAQGAYPRNTVRAWRADWKGFTQFCLEQRLSPLPAAPHTVRAYIQHCIEKEKKPATIRRVWPEAITSRSTAPGPTEGS